MNSNPDLLFGQTDGVELTPSAASVVSSQHQLGQEHLAFEPVTAERTINLNSTARQNHSISFNLSHSNTRTGERNGRTIQVDRRFSQPKESFDSIEVNHYQSNDSIMNPRISSSTNLNNDHSVLNTLNQSKRQPLVQILQNPSHSVSVNSQAKISLPNLIQQQALDRLDNTIDDFPRKASAYFGQNEGEIRRQINEDFGVQEGFQGFKQLDFQKMDEEELILEQNFQQITQNQRVPIRRQVSLTGDSIQRFSAIGKPPTSIGVSERSILTNQVQQRQAHTVQTSLVKQPQTTANLHRLAQSFQTSPLYEFPEAISSNQVSTLKQAGRKPEMLLPEDSLNLGSSNIPSQFKLQPSLINQGSSNVKEEGDLYTPMDNHSNQGYRQYDSVERSDRQVESLNEARNRQRSPSNDKYIFNEENFLKLQQKVTSQAKRLVSLQRTLKENKQRKSDGMREEIDRLERDYNLVRDREQVQRGVMKQQEANIEDMRGKLSQLTSDVASLTFKLEQANQQVQSQNQIVQKQKEQIDQLTQKVQKNLEKVGFKFGDGKETKVIEGYLEMMRYYQKSEQQRVEIESLEQQLHQFYNLKQKALAQLERVKEQEMTQIQQEHLAELNQRDADKSALSLKVEQLLSERDRLIETIEQLRKLENQLRDCKDQRDQLSRDNDALRIRLETGINQREKQEELLVQVKENLSNMREQRESLNLQLVANQDTIAQLSATIKEKEGVIELLRNKLQDLDESLEEVKMSLETEREVREKDRKRHDDEMERQRFKIDQAFQSLVEKDKLIDKLVEDSRDLKTKVGALEHTRECLRKTLKETQEELVRLVEAHEKLTQKQHGKTKDNAALLTEIGQLKVELVKKQTLLEDYQERVEDKEVEIRRMRDRLAKKDETHLEHERTFISDLKFKEKTQAEMEGQVRTLERSVEEMGLKIAFLEQLRQESKEQEKQLKKTLELKTQAFEQLNQEVRQVRRQYEMQTQDFEMTINNELNCKEEVETSLNHRIMILEQQIDLLVREKELNQKALSDTLLKIDEYEPVRQELAQTKENNIQIQNRLAEFEKRENEYKILGDQANSVVDKFIRQMGKVENVQSHYPFIHQIITKLTQSQSHSHHSLFRLHQVTVFLIEEVKKFILKDKQEQNKKDDQKDLSDFDIQLNKLQLNHKQSQTIQVDHHQVYPETDRLDDRKLPPLDQVQQNERQLKSVCSFSKEIDSGSELCGICEEVRRDARVDQQTRDFLEKVVTKVVQMVDIGIDFRQLLNRILSLTHLLQQRNKEIILIKRKVRREQQRLNEIQNLGRIRGTGLNPDSYIYKNEVGSLSQIIDKEREQVEQQNKKIAETEQEIEQSLEEISKMDFAQSRLHKENQVKVVRLQEQLIQMTRSYEEAVNQREWAEAKLNELQSQIAVLEGGKSEMQSEQKSFSTWKKRNFKLIYNPNVPEKEDAPLMPRDQHSRNSSIDRSLSAGKMAVSNKEDSREMVGRFRLMRNRAQSSQERDCSREQAVISEQVVIRERRLGSQPDLRVTDSLQSQRRVDFTLGGVHRNIDMPRQIESADVSPVRTGQVDGETRPNVTSNRYKRVESTLKRQQAPIQEDGFEMPGDIHSGTGQGKSGESLQNTLRQQLSRQRDLPRQMDSYLRDSLLKDEKQTATYQLKNQILRCNSELEAEENFIRMTKGNHLLPMRMEERLKKDSEMK